MLDTAVPERPRIGHVLVSPNRCRHFSVFNITPKSQETLNVYVDIPGQPQERKQGGGGPHSMEYAMREVIGVVTTCPHCGKKHVESLANAKLEKVAVDLKGEILEMAVIEGTLDDMTRLGG